MTERVDLLECQWFVRRKDQPADLPGRVLDSLRTWMPEAQPVRFGNFEPLPHTLDDDGDDEFRRVWQANAAMLFWKATEPCHGGIAVGLGTAGTDRRTAPRYPVGSIRITFDLTALDDRQRRANVIDLFGHLVEATAAFYAHSYVTRGWGYTGRSLWSDSVTLTRPSLTQRERWRGLPSFPVWLAWCGPLYVPHVQGRGFVSAFGGLFRQDGDHPCDAGRPVWPATLAMRADAEPASVIPRGL
jgi:hypothetical protein